MELNEAIEYEENELKECKSRIDGILALVEIYPKRKDFLAAELEKHILLSSRHKQYAEWFRELQEFEQLTDMEQLEFMNLVYNELANDDDFHRADRIITAALQYANALIKRARSQNP